MVGWGAHSLRVKRRWRVVCANLVQQFIFYMPVHLKRYSFSGDKISRIEKYYSHLEEEGKGWSPGIGTCFLKKTSISERIISKLCFYKSLTQKENHQRSGGASKIIVSWSQCMNVRKHRPTLTSSPFIPLPFHDKLSFLSQNQASKLSNCSTLKEQDLIYDIAQEYSAGVPRCYPRESEQSRLFRCCSTSNWGGISFFIPFLERLCVKNLRLVSLLASFWLFSNMRQLWSDSRRRRRHRPKFRT